MKINPREKRVIIQTLKKKRASLKTTNQQKAVARLQMIVARQGQLMSKGTQTINHPSKKAKSPKAKRTPRMKQLGSKKERVN